MTAVVYPSAISRACAMLDESPVFSELPDGYIKVVVRIIKKINLSRLSAAITASRATLATESGKSIETVGRVIKWLEERGLILRTQVARAGLRGSRSPIEPTALLLDALQLTAAAQAKRAAGAASHPCGSNRVQAELCFDAPSYPQFEGAPAVSRDASRSVNQGKQSKEKQPAKAGAFVRVGRCFLPAELVWLVRDHGLSATAVLLLMKQARCMNQRLSDVVTVTTKYLRALHGQELFAYLRSLLSKERDYSYQAREQAQDLRSRDLRHRLAEKAAALQGRCFQTRDGKVTVTVEKDGLLSFMRGGRQFSTPMDQIFLDALDDGRLVQVGY